MSEKIYQMVTEQLVGMLEKGTIPWRKPWVGGEARFPRNMRSGRAYRGINQLILGSSPYGSAYWLSYKQAQEKGGQVRKGEKSYPVIFWKQIEVTDKDSGEQKKIPMLKYYRVFNVEQIDGIEVPDAPTIQNPDWNPIREAEAIVGGMQNPPLIIHDEPRAYYRPSSDTVNMPKPGLFGQEEEYYSVLFHELTHSTGHESRLNRPGISEISGFGSVKYSKEELIAEMGAAFLAAKAGIEQTTLENSAAYLQSWIKVLKGDPKLAIQAASQAQKAADHILGTFADA